MKIQTQKNSVLARATSAEVGREWLPTSSWSGRLILPRDEERDPKGSVYFEVIGAPESQAELRGKTVKLSLKDSPWVRRATQDIQFNQETVDNMAKGNMSPKRLNGWKSVSPLESLAGARPQNDVQVALEDVKVVGNPPTLVIEDEPTQISGNYKALIRFEKKLPGNRWQVRHWNSENGDFSGPLEVVESSGSNDFDPFQNRILNRRGYYLYGEPSATGVTKFKALEPRALTSLEVDQVVLGERSSLNYLKRNTWDRQAARKGQISKAELHPSRKPESLKSGPEYLVVHTFGGKEQGEGMLGMTTGHFALGTAKVVKDDFTGQDRLDIHYHQVYAHNPQGIVSGSMAWHNYMGSLESTATDAGPRGWLFHRPVADVLVDVPELQKTGHGYEPLEVLRDRLSEMQGRYRNGDGDGSSIVTAAQSCSMDSAQALFATVRDWEKDMKVGRVGTGDEVKKLLGFARMINRQVTPIFGLAPSAWHKTAGNSDNPGKDRKKWIPALLSPTTALPRDHADGLVMKALGAGHSAFLIKSDVIAFTNDLEPSAPVHVFSR